jgi:ribosomal protein S18 acetylase RimI-like enzyme
MSFNSGVAELDSYLKSVALANQSAHSAQTFVCTLMGSTSVIGYYTIASAAIRRDELPDPDRKRVRFPHIPVVEITRFAVDQNYQGRGIANALLRNALRRCLKTSEYVGSYAVVIQTRGQKAIPFFERYGFQPISGMAMYIPMRAVRAAFGHEAMSS